MHACVCITIPPKLGPYGLVYAGQLDHDGSIGNAYRGPTTDVWGMQPQKLYISTEGYIVPLYVLGSREINLCLLTEKLM